MKHVYPNVKALIGNTPIVEITRFDLPEGVRLFAKLEFFNPGGSVKDRLGVALIEDAERRGLLKPGGTIIEPTAGNTGFGLALAEAMASGLPVVATHSGGPSEIVGKDGTCGLLVRPGSPADLAA